MIGELSQNIIKWLRSLSVSTNLNKTDVYYMQTQCTTTKSEGKWTKHSWQDQTDDPEATWERLSNSIFILFHLQSWILSNNKHFKQSVCQFTFLNQNSVKRCSNVEQPEVNFFEYFVRYFKISYLLNSGWNLKKMELLVQALHCLRSVFIHADTRTKRGWLQESKELDKELKGFFFFFWQKYTIFQKLASPGISKKQII